jgi:uncharacterized protein (DUF488 family)
MAAADERLYSSRMATLFTAGHSTRAIEELMEMLRERRIETLTDVRRFPGSRRHPQFSRDALAASLDAAGIGYVHEADLGGRRAPRPDSPNTAWRVAAFRGYADYMAQPPFRAALARLLRRAVESPTAVLCAEAVPWRCHRRLIADAAVVQGFDVVHLIAPGRAESHALNPTARLVPATALTGAPDARPASPAGIGAAGAEGGLSWQLIYDRGPASTRLAPPTLPFPTLGEP